MRHFLFAIGLLGATMSLSEAARADKTFLVGGTVIEGKATRKAGKVVIDMESGQVVVPADSVARIERSDSTVGQFETRYAALPPGDVPARLALADYCRDHAMRSQERRLLLEVIDLEPNHAAARARLGYTKTETGWITQADAMRARGLVEHEGRSISPSDVVQLERVRLEADAARRRSETDAELEESRLRLAREQNQLEARKVELEAENEHARLQQSSIGFAPIYGYSSYGRYGTRAAFVDGCGPGRACARPTRTFVNPGPGSRAYDSSLSVVKVPYSRH